MSERFLDLGNGFWNIRGNLRIGGVLNVGTHCSLVRLSSGGFAFLDSYSLDDDTAAQVMAITDRGRAVRAILNLHPFHTLHCGPMHRMFPQARLFGSQRHHRKWPDLPWQPQPVEAPEVAGQFPDLRFSLPDGIDYICQNERVHAGSLLAYHPASGSLHVDDTLNVLPLPGLLRRLTGMPQVTFHPTLGKALQDRPGAARDFRDWALRIAGDWAESKAVCAAHSATLPIRPGSFADHIRKALRRVEKTLIRFEEKRR
ncbi:hypothetical protein [Paracoccus sp. AK26]|uniref:hypothetical protein n=1 Tax=Paracoccus sp. AK26 TaxID=2589076 RepID=UPI0014285AFC|nr:hypothetical protein [Paracoccus sp. AK26]QIR85066.1 hypothetical protein FIU66_07500 [Paracoccus sp. AK26]